MPYIFLSLKHKMMQIAYTSPASVAKTTSSFLILGPLLKTCNLQ